MQRPAKNELSYWRDQALTGACLATARYGAHEFERHVHDELVIVMTEGGAGRCETRTGSDVSGPGTILVFAPGEYHSGRVREDWNYREDVSIDALAALVGLSRFHLMRAFRKEFGIPPHAYASQRRLIEARKMLAAGHSPAVAAAEAGLYDQSHLNRLFKRAYGVTPGTYARLPTRAPLASQ
ncbi:AraC family transcriptional regulator [Trinickia sp. YCB016]